ncbi:MAG: hypothetical protein IJU25_04130, partial [Lachnospiraceae bacterium]|nr:hypothetical protein [Lachnospiraceae bacterium]
MQELVEAGVPYEGKLLYEVIPEDGASTGSTPSHGRSTVSSLTHGSFSQSIPSARDAGTYEVFYRFEGDETVFRTDPVKIERKKIKEIIDDKEKCEEEDDPAFSVSYEGVLQADLRDGSVGQTSPYGLLYGRDSDFLDHHILSREAGEEPGTYEIRWVETEETVGTDGTDPYAPTGSGEDDTGEEAAPSGNYEIEETVNGCLTIKEIPSHEVTVRIVNEGDPAGLANITVRGGGMYKEGKPVTLLALSAKPITKFLGWYDGDAILTEEGTYSFDQGTADTVFTARFYTKIIPVGKTYKLTFEADGEETQVVSLPVSFDPDTGDELEVVYTLPECRFTAPSKMVFDGWEIGGERYVPGDSLRITNDETVSPVWTKKYFSVKGLMDTYVYTGKQIRPMPQVFYGNNLLKERTDYSLSYRNNLNTGKATLIVSGRGSYAMNMQYTYEIVPADIGADDITADDLFLSYNGRAQMPAVSVKRNVKALRNNTDYTLSWKNENGIVNGAFTASGEYDITIIGKKNYTGKRTVKAVVALPSQELLSKAVISRIPDQACSGKIVKPDFKVTLKNRELTADDFDVLWPDDLTSPGLKTVTLRGKGNYRGIKRFTYKIVGVPIAKAVVTLPKTYAYTGMEIMPMGATAEADTNGVVVSVRAGNGEPVLL